MHGFNVQFGVLTNSFTHVPTTPTDPQNTAITPEMTLCPLPVPPTLGTTTVPISITTERFCLFFASREGNRVPCGLSPARLTSQNVITLSRCRYLSVSSLFLFIADNAIVSLEHYLPFTC